MGHISTGNGKDLNVELNIVPFIDLMSCLTAFLLVTAVWVNVAQLEIQPRGRGRDGHPGGDAVQLSVLVEPEDIWIGVSRLNEFQRIPRTASGHDWTRVESTLREHKASAFFSDRLDIEIAGGGSPGHPVAYQSIVLAMDVATKVGFSDVGLTDPRGLSAQPTL